MRTVGIVNRPAMRGLSRAVYWGGRLTEDTTSQAMQAGRS